MLKFEIQARPTTSTSSVVEFSARVIDIESDSVGTIIYDGIIGDDLLVCWPTPESAIKSGAEWLANEMTLRGAG